MSKGVDKPDKKLGFDRLETVKRKGIASAVNDMIDSNLEDPLY